MDGICGMDWGLAVGVEGVDDFEKGALHTRICCQKTISNLIFQLLEATASCGSLFAERRRG